MTERPLIIVLSRDEDEVFDWMSGGWYAADVRHTQAAKDLWNLAKKCIEDGANVVDVIERLQAAGFAITREHPATFS